MNTTDNLSKKNKPAFIVKTKSLREILSSLRKAELWLMIAAFAAFFASAFFVVKYFVGGEMTPGLWSGEQWMNAFLGLGITAIITAAQAFLYASGYKGHAAIIAAFIVVFFGLFSEISQSMEREDATVRSRSQSSPTYQAALGVIGQLGNQVNAPQVNPYASRIAKAEQVLARCKVNLAKGKEKHCDGDQAKVDSLKHQAQLSMNSSTAGMQAALSTALSTAQQLEYDENKHYAMIRLLKQLFGVTGVWASFLFSVIIIGTFEYAFHFVGGYVADHKRALLLLGRDAQGRRVLPQEEPDFSNTTSPEIHSNALHEEYLDWVSPERSEHAESCVSDTQNTQTTDQRNGLILIREKIANNEITLFNKQNGETGQINAALARAGIGKNDPERRKKDGLIDWILKQLVTEGVLIPSGNASNHKIQFVKNENETAGTSDTQHAGSKVYDFTQKRFFKLIYTEVRSLILNGDIKPTVRPVTDAVTTIIRHKSHLLGVKPSLMGKPQRQQIAQSILEHLESETVITRNKEGGVGKPRHVLAPKFLKALQVNRGTREGLS